MAIIAPTFDFMKVAPGDDGHLYDYLSDGGGIDPEYAEKLAISSSGLTVTVAPGMAIVKGRMVKNTSSLEVSIPANSNGFIVITIDLTKTNTFTGTPGDDNYKPVNNQVRIERVASLVQQDIINGGSIYHFPLAQYTSNGSTTTIVKEFSTFRQVGSKVLWTGRAAWNQSATCSEKPANFRTLLVNVKYGSNVETVAMIRNQSGGFDRQYSHGLSIDTTADSKGYGMFACELDVTNIRVRFTVAKTLSSGGTIANGGNTTGNLAVVGVIGIR